MLKTETSYFKEITAYGDYICPQCGIIILVTEEKNKPCIFVECPKCGTDNLLTTKLWKKCTAVRSGEMVNRKCSLSDLFIQRLRSEVYEDSDDEA